MGGCCCFPRKELKKTLARSYCYPPPVEQQLFSSRCVPNSAISPGRNTSGNFDTSSPDTYQAPPAPLPYETSLMCSQTLHQTGNKIVQVPLDGYRTLEENTSGISLQSGYKNKGDSEHGSPEVIENKNTQLSVSVVHLTEEEDVCPICLEEYDADNPCIPTKCKHHFHLSCILEWMERSDTCPVCDQVMVIDHTFDE